MSPGLRDAVLIRDMQRALIGIDLENSNAVDDALRSFELTERERWKFEREAIRTEQLRRKHAAREPLAAE